MKPIPLVFLTLGAACTAPIHYAAYPGYMNAARGIWPLLIEELFPESFGEEDASRLHEAITLRTGLRPEQFRDYRGFFGAAGRELDRARALSAIVGLSREAFARGLPESEAVEIVRKYLSAVSREVSGREYWLGGEPTRAFDRLLDYDDPRAGEGAPTMIKGPGMPGPIPCWGVRTRCRIEDLRGCQAVQSYVFLVTGVSGRAGIYEVRSSI
jgi:hypothetical protein